MEDNKKFGINDIAQAINDYEPEDTLRKYTDRMITRLQEGGYIEYADAYTEAQKDRIAALMARFRSHNLKVGKVAYKILDIVPNLMVTEVGMLLQELRELITEQKLDISDQELNICWSKSNIMKELQRIVKRVCSEIFG